LAQNPLLTMLAVLETKCVQKSVALTRETLKFTATAIKVMGMGRAVAMLQAAPV